VRQGLRSLRSELPGILATRTDVLSPRMLRIIEDLAGDWRRLDERIGGLSSEIETLARQDQACERLMTVPGIGPIISSAMVAAIGTGDAFGKGRDFGAWLGLVPKQLSTGGRIVFADLLRGRAFLAELGNVRAGHECLASGTGEHHNPNVRVVLKFGKNFGNGLPHVHRNRIVTGRIVEHHPSNCSLLVGDHPLRADLHGQSSVEMT
jgi:hypothetical protein